MSILSVLVSSLIGLWSVLLKLQSQCLAIRLLSFSSSFVHFVVTTILLRFSFLLYDLQHLVHFLLYTVCSFVVVAANIAAAPDKNTSFFFTILRQPHPVYGFSAFQRTISRILMITKDMEPDTGSQSQRQRDAETTIRRYDDDDDDDDS